MENHHFRAEWQRFLEIPGPAAGDEENDVWPHLILFVDHSEADPRIPLIQIIEQLIQCVAGRFHPIVLAGIGEQRLGNGDLHDQRMIPASTA